MKEYHTQDIRNICFSSHTGSGKTTLAEAILYATRFIERMGRIEDGGTVSDYDAEEISRKVSIAAGILPAEYRDCKINMFDFPGYRDFICEVKSAIRVCDAMIIPMDATSGVEVGTEFAMEYAAEYDLPRMFFINKMDKERANFRKAVESLREHLGIRPLILALPVGQESSFSGVIDLVRMKMITTDKGKQVVNPIPDNLLPEAEAAHAEMVETAAEGDDELTMKFLEEQPLSSEEIVSGLKSGFVQNRFCPVFCGSAQHVLGIYSLMNFITQCCPSPAERPAWQGTKAGSEDLIEIPCDEHAPSAVFVFKTALDPYQGKISYIRVVSGVLKSDSSLLNVQRGKDEKIVHALVVRGKKSETVHQLHAGDIGALIKLDHTVTNDSLCDSSFKIVFPPTILPNRNTHMAVKVPSKSEEEKLGMHTHRLMEQDESIVVRRDPETRQNIISGHGDTHLDVAISRLKTMSKIEGIELSVPRVAYRETITRKGDDFYRHKKQTGGRGQFGEVYLRVEPASEGYEFVWEVVGGNIPTKFMPAVEKGIIEALETGILAGYKVVNVRVACYDGKYHPVDSSEMAFKIAASMGFKKVAALAGPVILEPIYNLKVTVPEQFMGDVMGDISGKRGKILGNTSKSGKVTIEAQVPLVEIYTYSRDLRSMTQGRGVFDMAFTHYEVTPPSLQQKIIEEAQKLKEEEA